MPQMHHSLYAYCATLDPLVFWTFPLSSPGAPTSVGRERSLAAKGGTKGKNVGRYFYLNVDFHVSFRVLLHAANLRHGTDGFTFPSEGRRAEDFFFLKNPDGFGRV
jgi:hypothetical protein